MSGSGAPSRLVLPDAPALFARAAALVLDTIGAALEGRGRAAVALAGGSTPARLYRAWKESRELSSVRWEKVDFVFGDERCVPPEDPASNYRQAREGILVPLGADPGRVHRIRGELGPDRAAAVYESELAGLLGAGPELDLVLLGMGADGHTASLFPRSAALAETRRLAVPSRSPTPPRERVTLTLPVLNASRSVLFLVSGRAKAAAVARALDPSSDLPAARVRPSRGELLWLLDREAAAELPVERDSP